MENKVDSFMKFRDTLDGKKQQIFDLLHKTYKMLCPIIEKPDAASCTKCLEYVEGLARLMPSEHTMFLADVHATIVGLLDGALFAKTNMIQVVYKCRSWCGLQIQQLNTAIQMPSITH